MSAFDHDRRGPTGASAGPIVVCPLAFERNILARTPLAAAATIAVCGPGPEAIAAWAERQPPPDGPVLLAGLAGALAEALPSGAARVITEVRSTDGPPRRPTWTHGAAPPCVITSAPSVVLRPEDRRDLARRTRADLVDLESVAFATLAVRQDWSWGIVRGVSDDASCSLPPDIEDWVDDLGHPRPWRVAAALGRRPWLAPRVWRLRRDGIVALRAVAGLIQALLAG